MSDESTNITPAAFIGQWIGETQGWDMPAHLWEIHLQGDYLRILTRWEGETRSSSFHARMVLNKPAFEIRGAKEIFTATLVDKQHFVIPGWCWGTTASNEREGSYDVVFSRQGIAELSARAAYLKSLEQRSSDEEKS